MLRGRSGILYGTATIIVLAPPLVWGLSRLLAGSSESVIVPVAYAHDSAVGVEGLPAAGLNARDSRAGLPERDPLALVQRGYERYRREVRDYRCVLLIQERLSDGLSPIQEVEVRVRTSPRAIYMVWRKNATQVKRALFKEDSAFVDEQGRQVARVEPAGSVVRLFVDDVLMPINGERARKASRRSIDQCGFATTFELMDHYCRLAREKGDLDLRFAGAGEVDRRPTLVLVRYLPYTGEGGIYPDAKLVLHLDREWLLPVAVESYADRESTQLLGRYVFTKVQLNPGLGEKDFEF